MEAFQKCLTEDEHEEDEEDEDMVDVNTQPTKE